LWLNGDFSGPSSCTWILNPSDAFFSFAIATRMWNVGCCCIEADRMPHLAQPMCWVGLGGRSASTAATALSLCCFSSAPQDRKQEKLETETAKRDEEHHLPDGKGWPRRLPSRLPHVSFHISSYERCGDATEATSRIRGSSWFYRRASPYTKSRKPGDEIVPLYRKSCPRPAAATFSTSTTLLDLAQHSRLATKAFF